MDKCIKCGGKELSIKHIPEGTLINSSSTRSVSDEFQYSVEYDFYYKVKAAKEHLNIICKTCGFSLRKNTIDNQ